ncbi:MAG TPA: hypothetical protein VNT55_08410, partial [Baekduia sp.]|nr:hypothetical protein [Baekduia sp.]
GVAVRRLVALGAGGGTVLDLPLQQPPASPGPCGAGSSGGALSTLVTYSFGHDRPLAGPGPHAVHAADDGAKLCLAFDRAPRAPADCAIPEDDPADVFLGEQATATGVVLTGLVPAEVAGARVTLDDGTTRDVAAAPIPGYAGRYAAVVRVIAAQVDRPRTVAGWALLDARGRVLNGFDRGGPDPVPQHAATVLRTPGLPALRAARVPKGRHFGGFACLALGPLEELADCSAAGPGLFIVRAFCAPRRIVIFGLLSHSSDRLVVETAAGREVAARQAVLPAAIRAGKGLTAAMVVLPAGTGARRVILRGKAGGRTDLVLPPAAEQCGYRDFAWIMSAFPTSSD